MFISTGGSLPHQAVSPIRWEGTLLLLAAGTICGRSTVTTAPLALRSTCTLLKLYGDLTSNAFNNGTGFSCVSFICQYIKQQLSTFEGCLCLCYIWHGGGLWYSFASKRAEAESSFRFICRGKKEGHLQDDFGRGPRLRDSGHGTALLSLCCYPCSQALNTLVLLSLPLGSSAPSIGNFPFTAAQDKWTIQSSKPIRD